MTSNSITVTESGPRRRWRPAPLVSVSVLVHLGAVAALIVHPDAWRWSLAAVAIDHVVLIAAVFWPRGSLLGPNITRLPEEAVRRGEVALTFDDGPEPELTARILDMLDRYQAKASFFCIGERAVAYPDLAREIVRRGHSVENHSFGHRFSFALLGMSRLRHEVERSQALLETITGRRPEFFRAPAGFRSPLLDPVLSGLGLRYVTWTRRGFDAVSTDGDRILRRLSQGLEAGEILLLHDSAAAAIEVLPRLLERMQTLQLKSVSLPTAFASRPLNLQEVA